MLAIARRRRPYGVAWDAVPEKSWLLKLSGSPGNATRLLYITVCRGILLKLLSVSRWVFSTDCHSDLGGFGEGYFGVFLELLFFQFPVPTYLSHWNCARNWPGPDIFLRADIFPQLRQLNLPSLCPPSSPFTPSLSSLSQCICDLAWFELWLLDLPFFLVWFKFYFYSRAEVRRSFITTTVRD